MQSQNAAELQELGLSKSGPLWSITDAAANAIRTLPEQERHLTYHRFCREIFRRERRNPPPPQVREIATQGFTVMRGVVPRETCASLSAQMGDWLEAAGGGMHVNANPEKIFKFKTDDTNRVVPLTPDILNAQMPLVRRILNRQVTEICESFIGSHFKLDSLRLFRSLPNPEPLVSFRWHCDSAPPGQMHAFLYLTDSGPGGEQGATEFLPWEQSVRLHEHGYGAWRVDQRILEVEELGAFGQELRPHVLRPEPQAGDVVLFPPGTVFHRGVPPLHGHRDAMLLVLMPSFDPWAVSLAVHGTAHMLKKYYGYLPVLGDPLAP